MTATTTTQLHRVSTAANKTYSHSYSSSYFVIKSYCDQTKVVLLLLCCCIIHL